MVEMHRSVSNSPLLRVLVCPAVVQGYRFSEIPEAPAPQATEEHEEDKRKLSAAALCRRLRSTAFVTGLWHHFVRLR